MATRIQVELGERSYHVEVGSGMLHELGPLCARSGLGGRALLVSDSNVAPLYAERCLGSLRGAGYDPALAVVPAGESSKSERRLFELYDAALDHRLDRSSFVVALGGGVVGDLAGYLAASWLRGIPVVQVPTSLLAMVDSSVGGKTGINLPRGKNLVGAFHQPSAVLADVETLKTLPEREFRSGLAEVVKHAVIRDAALFEELEAAAGELSRDRTDRLGPIVARNVSIKADVVCRDEREGGLRAILNFGHTLGHALETALDYRGVLHGEAVAVGMVYAARLSTARAGLPVEAAARIERLLDRLGLPVSTDQPWQALRPVMSRDKKAAGGSVRFVLAEALGRATPGHELPEDLLEEVWHGGRQ
jgi:3-dehydroquinate synthase